MNQYEMLVYWIKEREHIRELKEAGQPKPWTEDPVLRRYRFCNVHREDDKVTRWIAKYWRGPHAEHDTITRAMLLARMINWPETLNEIGYPHEWNKDKYAELIGNRMGRGEKTWTGAYMITAESDGTPKHVSVCKTVDACDWTWKFDETCRSVWERLQDLPRIGSFMAAQVVADLKYTKVLRDAEDWAQFCAPGPGSMRGLNRLLGYPLGTEWGQEEFQACINSLQRQVHSIDEIMLDAQDMQNCLCEFDKYSRGSSRTTYNG